MIRMIYRASNFGFCGKWCKKFNLLKLKDVFHEDSQLNVGL